MNKLISLELYAVVLTVLFISARSMKLGRNEINPTDNFFDLEELSPQENNCTQFNSNIICSKIPLFCRNVCDIKKRLDFDAHLKRISPFSFGSYQIKESMIINIQQGGLERIETDAFNGLIIESDTELVIHIEYPNKKLSTIISDKEDQNIDYLNENDDQFNQIEYDMEMSSTKPVKMSKESNSFLRSSEKLFIDSNAFRGITIKEGGRLIFNIKNSNQIEFSQKSLSGDENKFLTSSSLIISIENSNLVQFKTDCAKFWRANTPDYDYDTYYNTDYNPKLDNAVSFQVLFKLNLTNVKQVVFEQNSFSNLKLSNSSTFQILVNKFQEIKLDKLSFAQIEQSDLSYFELNLSNGKKLILNENTFDNLKQAHKSKFILFLNIEANICLPQNFLSNLYQRPNSTVRLTFLLKNSNNLVFNRYALSNLNQSQNSFIQINIINSNDFILKSEAITNLNQGKSSVFEIWTSKGNFTINSKAFKNITQDKNSSIRIGSSSGFFKQSTYALDNFVSDSTAEIAYDFASDTKFTLKFPQRPIPRFIPYDDNQNQENQSKKKTIEEIVWNLFPNFGRNFRPDRINLQGFNLNPSDFCKISQLPFDILVKLNPKTQCSCTVYYLYRIVRRMDAPNGIKEWLSSAPECYRNLFLDQTKPSQLEYLENFCKFNELVQKCQKKESLIQDEETDDSTMFCENETILQTKKYEMNDKYLEVDTNLKNEKNDIVVKVVEDVQNLKYDEIKTNESDGKLFISGKMEENDSDENYSDEDYADTDEDEFSEEVDSQESYNEESEENTTIINITTKKAKFSSISSVLNRINKNFSSFFKRIFYNKILFGLFILGIILIILISTAIAYCICVNRKRRHEGFSIYYDYENEENSDENLTDSDTENVRGKMDTTYARNYLGSMVKNKIKRKNSFAYAKLKDGFNDSSSKSKILAVRCNTNSSNNSFESEISYLSDEYNQQHYASSQNSVNVKTNPFSLN